jgi:hypothetical protein
MIVAPQTPELGIRDIKRVEFGIKLNPGWQRRSFGKRFYSRSVRPICSADVAIEQRCEIYNQAFNMPL